MSHSLGSPEVIALLSKEDSCSLLGHSRLLYIWEKTTCLKSKLHSELGPSVHSGDFPPTVSVWIAFVWRN